MDIRTKLLDAAARVYAEAGYRGATTRRITQEAGVNEITLFRHFGSKTSLIIEAVRCASVREEMPSIPDAPAHPRRELTDWCRAQLAHLHRMRSIIRTCMGEVEERPEIIPCVGTRPTGAAQALATYLTQCRERGLAIAEFDPIATAALLMGALFADAMGRDIMPDVYPYSIEASADHYAELVLRAIGAQTHGVPLDDARRAPQRKAKRRETAPVGES